MTWQAGKQEETGLFMVSITPYEKKQYRVIDNHQQRSGLHH